ncbi:YfcZ/YiiS family protein [Shewanella sp. NKUCC05_KAH]|jgi:uncharacterized protein YfcZ (UPF0381/DUF406 family)|uniref:DUF406 family protein n=1 Tax=Shewanella oncorhynchi TaxID=2726434 RepID=A0AA50Q4V1_9GAMM|nr:MULTISPECIES: DUF406 family protein [Shewanella]EGT3626596.1 DUF406 family protein [Morganella morganii]RBP80998.1 uncharacterized protein YfcZ (UPF0381/DUF406 family) [Shewanella putrefaciens]MBI1676011.1 DUF406 family protein [Shewanella sp. DW31]MBS0043070.1 DUF406 family protein [Shewanella sp. M16]MBW3529210.1 YfcZ/YiiS family protein [Shewanella sp. NKUCC05_KAH]
MKGIIEAQSPTVNDTCTDCGSFVDIGAVIDEHDTLLTLNFVGDSAQADAESMATRAQTRFAEVQTEFVTKTEGVDLLLTFNVSAEKMIFQLENGL